MLNNEFLYITQTLTANACLSLVVNLQCCTKLSDLANYYYDKYNIVM